MRNGQNSVTSSHNIARTRAVMSTIEIPSESPSASVDRTPVHQPLAAINPSPTPARRSRVRRRQFHYLTSACERDDRDGNQVVSEEHAFGSHRWLSMRARMDGAGNVYVPEIIEAGRMKSGWSMSDIPMLVRSGSSNCLHRIMICGGDTDALSLHLCAQYVRCGVLSQDGTRITMTFLVWFLRPREYSATNLSLFGAFTGFPSRQRNLNFIVPWH